MSQNSKSNAPNTNNRKKQKKKKKKLGKIIALIIGVPLIVGPSYISIKYYPTIKKLYLQSKEISKDIDKYDFINNSPSEIYDNKNNLLFKAKGDIEIKYAEYKTLPNYLKNAIISVEDKRFYKHHGIDYEGICRAGLLAIKTKGRVIQGGSTLTQQLIKNVYLTNERTMNRKIKECFIAKDLEKQFSKEQILEYYVNNIYYANNLYGIRNASLGYFGKELKDLSLSECALLTAIPNNPEFYNPYTHLDNVIKKRNIILKLMLDQNFISQKEYDKTLNEKVILQDKSKLIPKEKFNPLKPFMVNDIAKTLLKKENFNFQYHFENNKEKEEYNDEYNKALIREKHKIYTKGYKIYTSFDKEKQDFAQKTLDNALSPNQKLSKEGKYKLQGSIVTIDNRTGLVVSAIGGRTSPKVDFVNRTYQSFRQNGSTMKPIGVYGPAYDTKYYPFTIFNDSKLKGGPRNSTGYLGNITLTKALEISSNTVADKVFYSITPKVGLSYLEKMEFKNIVKSDYGQQSALGGLSIGTNTLEMAGAYSTFARDGKFNTPSMVVKIINNKNQVIYSHPIQDKQAFRSSTAYLITESLKGVLTRGTARGYTLNNNIACAGKTGTTNHNKDVWFAGYSPIYTTVIWVGYDSPKEVEGAYSYARCPKIWKKIMDHYHLGMKDLVFKRPSTISEGNINSRGELIPSSWGGKRVLYPNDRPPKENEIAKYQNDVRHMNDLIDIKYEDLKQTVISIDGLEEFKDILSNYAEELYENYNSDYVKNSLIQHVNYKVECLRYQLTPKVQNFELPLPKIEIPDIIINKEDDNKDKINKEIDNTKKKETINKENTKPNKDINKKDDINNNTDKDITDKNTDNKDNENTNNLPTNDNTKDKDSNKIEE